MYAQKVNAQLSLCLLFLSVFGALESHAQISNGTSSEAPDSLAESRQEFVEQVLTSIAGREEDPSGDVFENIQIFENVPAGRLLRIMDIGFARSLGVTCTHCHDPEAWPSDDKRPKRAAREMWEMVRAINQDLLGRIENLKSSEPTVNCTSCHRGQIKPALDM